jgi:hypothetical protein
MRGRGLDLGLIEVAHEDVRGDVLFGRRWRINDIRRRDRDDAQDEGVQDEGCRKHGL